MEACEDGGCQGPLKSLSPKSCPATKGQAGDGPKPAELPPAPGTERNPEMELEKVRMEFELTRLKYLHEENERQRQHEVVMGQLQRERERQHEVVMEQLQQEAAPHLVGDKERGTGRREAWSCGPLGPRAGAHLPWFARHPTLQILDLG